MLILVVSTDMSAQYTANQMVLLVSDNFDDDDFSSDDCNCNCNFSAGSPLSNTDFQWSPATYTRTKNITYNIHRK